MTVESFSTGPETPGDDVEPDQTTGSNDRVKQESDCEVKVSVREEGPITNEDRRNVFLKYVLKESSSRK